MAIHSSLVAFLKTGQIGPIEIGMTPAEVQRLAGPPSDSTVGYNLQLYGSVEFGYSDGPPFSARLAYVQIEHANQLGRFVGAGRLILRDNRFEVASHEGRFDFGSFVRFARRHHIALVKVVRAPFICTREFGLLTEGGVLATFSYRDDCAGPALDTLITGFVDPSQADHFPVGFGQATRNRMLRGWRRIRR